MRTLKIPMSASLPVLAGTLALLLLTQTAPAAERTPMTDIPDPLADLAPATQAAQAGLATAGQKMRVMLVASKEATIASRLHATISKLHVKESERFKEGQPLISFDCRDLAAEKAVAQAELQVYSTTNRANAELYAEKMIGTLEKNLSQAKVAEAGAKIKAVGARMTNCTINAPFDGQVVELMAKTHETLQPGAAIMLIQNSRDLEAHVHVPSVWMSWLKPGARFTAHIEETGQAYQAEVISLGARVDPVSRTLKIYAKIPGEHPDLLPGMSG